MGEAWLINNMYYLGHLAGNMMAHFINLTTDFELFAFNKGRTYVTLLMTLWITEDFIVGSLTLNQKNKSLITSIMATHTNWR